MRLGPALVLFIGDSESGKSSLSLHLAAAGHRFFGDDRILLDLSVEPVASLCLGLAPKVRLPLPPEVGAVFTRFVAARTRREMAGQAYLSLAEGSAGFGEGSPVGALVLADRRDGAETSLAPAGRGDLRPVAIGMPVHRNEAGVPVVRHILWRIRCIVNHVWSGPGQARTPESQRWGSRPRADGVAKCIAKRN
jgi:hypothetical protein